MDSHTVPSALRDEEINRAHTTVAQLHKELAARKAEFDQLTQVLMMYSQSGGAPDVDTQIRALESALKDSNERYAEAIAEVSRLSQHVGWLEHQGGGAGEPPPPAPAAGSEGRVKELELQLQAAQAEVKSLKDGKEKTPRTSSGEGGSGSAVLKARVAELERALKEKELQHQQFIDAIQETENESDARLVQLQEQLASAAREGQAASEKDAKALQSAQDDLTQKITTLESALADAKARAGEVSGLTDAVAEAKQKIADLEHTLSAKETMHTQFVQAVQESQDETTARITELESARDKAAANVTELEAAVAEAASRVFQLETDLAEAQKAAALVAALENDLAGEKSRVADLEHTVAQSVDYKAQLELKESEFQTLLAQLADSDARLTTQKGEYESRLADAQEHIRSMEGQFASAQVLLQDSEQEKQEQHQGIQEIERVWSEKVQVAEAHAQELEKSWSERLQAAETSHAEKITAAESRTAEVEAAAKAQADEATASARDEIEALRTELEKSDKEKAEVTARLKELEEHVGGKQQEFAAMETQLNVVNELLSSTDGDVQKNKERIEQLEATVASREAALASVRQGVEALLNHMDQATSGVSQDGETAADPAAQAEPTRVEAAAN